MCISICGGVSRGRVCNQWGYPINFFLWTMPLRIMQVKRILEIYGDLLNSKNVNWKYSLNMTIVYCVMATLEVNVISAKYFKSI